MAISKKIIKHLDAKGYKYEIISHKTTFTAFDTARTTQKQRERVKSEEIVKALVLKAEKVYLLALVPANRKLDKKKILKTVNMQRKRNKEKLAKSIDLAKEAWMKKNIPGRVGATPPFREITKLDIYIDNVLSKQKNLYVGSGEYDFSIKLATNQYLKNEMPVKGSFGTRRT